MRFARESDNSACMWWSQICICDPILSPLPLRHVSKQPYHLYGRFKARPADDMWRPGVLYQPTAVQYGGPVRPLSEANN